jgi:arylsulfatase
VGVREQQATQQHRRIRVVAQGEDAELQARRPALGHLDETVLEAAGIPEPETVDGISQEPMDGTSFLYTFEDAGAPERHTTQYFEMFGARAMYADGWWAASRPDRLPWDVSPATLAAFGPDADWDPDRDVGWELYDLRSDFSQAHDLAAAHPDKVQELQELWWSEAERNRVLPLMAGVSVMYGILPPMPTRTRFAFAACLENVQRGMIPRIYGRSYSIKADVEIPEAGAEGVLVANADFIGGFALWVDGDQKLNHTYSFLGVDTFKAISDKAVPAGRTTLKMVFTAAERPGLRR